MIYEQSGGDGYEPPEEYAQLYMADIWTRLLNLLGFIKKYFKKEGIKKKEGVVVKLF
ncbi:MAG TPA: hypothetical protein GX531_04060 [Methanothermobacter sp.]|nr:hypothetical protein [Methanothermobacter sp.]